MKCVGCATWVLFFIIVLSTDVTTKVAEIPPGFPICYRDDPDINSCMVKAANDAKPFLVKGIPEMNLRPISPFVIPEVNLQQGTQALNFKATFRNMTFYGFDTYNFTRFDFDLENLKFYCEVMFGKISIDSNYEITGKILVAPISGKGNVKLDIESSFGTLTENSEFVKRKGITFLEPKNVKVALKFGKTTSRFNGLFDGNEELAKATNRILNENSDELIREITPAIDDVMKEIFTDMLARSRGRIPYDVVLPLRLT